jgi:benzoyl-CoA reductase/2-hydroxyglutaryl-CoA dehydratase subunit BcrC/BadD/HgdB
MTPVGSNKNRLSALVKASRLLKRMNAASPSSRKSAALYYEMMEKYFARLQEAPEKGDFIAAHTVFFPAEIIYAMDLLPMHTETTTWMLALFTGECADLLAAGAELGMASEICSPHRGITGAYAIRALPRPDVMLWSNMVCDNTAKSGELIMDINKCPGYFLDHPFKETPEEIRYFTGELEGMVRFLEQQSGKKMDWDRLSEIVARMAYQIELFRQRIDLRQAVPTPFSAQGFLELLSVDYLFPGQPEAITYLETLKDELSEMVEEGKGAVPNERFRLMSLFIPPMYLMGFLDKLCREYGAVSVRNPFLHSGVKADWIRPDRWKALLANRLCCRKCACTVLWMTVRLKVSLNARRTSRWMERSTMRT